MITHETRKEAYETAPRLIRRQAVLEALGKDRLTAREIMSKMGFTDPNSVRPRVTELMQDGIIEACGKKKDAVTRKTVAIFKIKEDKNA